MKFKTLVLILLFASVSFTGFSQSRDKIKTDFVKTFVSGKSTTLDAYFEGFVSIQLPDHSGLFPATRSKIYLATFLKNHPVKKFSLKKSGTTGNNYFLIGLLECHSASWNVYFLFSPDKGNYKVQQIEIEESEK